MLDSIGVLLSWMKLSIPAYLPFARIILWVTPKR